jgi:hypothetical protein
MNKLTEHPLPDPTKGKILLTFWVDPHVYNDGETHEYAGHGNTWLGVQQLNGQLGWHDSASHCTSLKEYIAMYAEERESIYWTLIDAPQCPLCANQS